LVVTSPDNPTGRTMPLDEQILLARTAFDLGYPFVLFDWIYHWVTTAARRTSTSSSKPSRQKNANA
jgi:aspartate/methionine/tyrosine aminotransferase